MRVNRLNRKLNIVGINIQKYRKMKGLTQDDICTKMSLLGISLHRSDIYNIEHSERIIKDFEAYAFCKVLGISLDMLFEKAEEEFNL